MKKTVLTIVLALTMLSFIGWDCKEQSTSDKVLNKKQEQLMQEANAQVGMPGITHFQERKLLKTVLELRDQENLVCYAYLFSEMTGKLVFIGKCIGFGIPYATEFTNPQKIVYP